MSLVRVYIATTAGPVAIQRITEEDAEVNSVICLAGKAVALPISGAYDAFVRNPTGVVQRHFGHSAYRIDVSEKIDEGYSWQFGVFAAHALQRAARLAGPADTATSVIIATGELDRDLQLHPVDGVTEKIAKLEPVLNTLAHDAERVVIAVPAMDDAPWKQGFAETRLAGGGAVEVVGAGHAGDLLEHLGIGLPTRAATPPPAADAPTATTTPPKGRKRRALLLAALLALAAMGAAAGGAVYAPEIKSLVEKWTAAEPKQAAAETPPSKPEPKVEPPPEPPAEVKTEPAPPPAPEPAAAPMPEPVAAPEPETAPATGTTPTPTEVAEVDQIPSKPAPPRKPAPTPLPSKAEDSDRIEEARLPDLANASIRISIQELRAPPGYDCGDVRAGRTQPMRRAAATRTGTDRFRPARQKDLCTVEIVAAGDDPALYVFGRYQRWTRNRPAAAPPDKVIDLGPRQGSVRWTVDIPDRLRRGAVFRVFVFAAADAYTPSRRVLDRLQTMDPRSDRMQRLLNRLRRRGIEIKVSQFRIVPDRLLRDRSQPLPGYPPPPDGTFRPRPSAFPPPPRG